MTLSEVRREVARCLADGMTLSGTARHLGITRSKVQRAQKWNTENGVTVDGLTPNDVEDGEKIIDSLIRRQCGVEDILERRYSQEVHISGNKPVAVVLMSDIHLGGGDVDYRSVKADAELVANTDGMYAIGVGDYTDNWIGKLEGLQRGQAVNFEAEIALMEWWFETLKKKLVAVVAGNHDTGRTKRLAGIDYIKRMLKGAELLYDTEEVRFLLTLGKAAWRVKLRHIWRGNSQYNDTHAIEKDPRFGDDAFDIGIGGHTHRGTLFREFMFHGQRRLAVLCGTYKMHDQYAVQLGYPRSPHDASGALILFPDGRMMHMQDLGIAADFLNYARG